MSRISVVSLTVGWVAVTLLLSELRWFRRLPLAERLAPFVPVGTTPGSKAPGSKAPDGRVEETGQAAAPVSLAAARTWREAASARCMQLGSAGASLLGVAEPLALRLTRAGMDMPVQRFRARQLAAAGLAGAAAAVLSIVVGLPGALAVGAATVGCSAVFAGWEQRIDAVGRRHAQAVFAELDIFAEQLAMLLSSAMSLGGALAYAAQRSDGACARDLRRVCSRIDQGITAEAALAEWNDIVPIPQVRRLTAVLQLHQQTAELPRLVAAEASAIRADAHRHLLERIERRNEQVWIPVTFATLVPGVIFLSIPFADALGGLGGL